MLKIQLCITVMNYINESSDCSAILTGADYLKIVHYRHI